MKTLFTLLLFTSLSYSNPPDHANNNNENSNGNGYGWQDDEPETPIGYTELSIIGAIALGLCLTKKKRNGNNY